MLNPIEETFETKTLAAPNMIVVATDLTDTEELLPHAIAQAKASNAALRFIYAIAPYETFVPEAGKVAYIDPAEMARDARMMLEQVANQVSAQGIPCTATVRLGEPADVVAEFVKETGAQRVIVRTHGRTGVKRLFLGSTAREILTRIDVPVCTIGPHCLPPSREGFHTIMHPTALESDCSISGQLALDLAEYYRAELTMLYVVSPDTAIEPYLDPHYAFEKLASILPSESENAQMKVHTLVVPGDTTKEILRAAEEIHADMIVLGVHPGLPHGALRKEEHAYSVVTSALCPVLSFRTPEHKGKKSSNTVHDACVIC